MSSTSKHRLAIFLVLNLIVGGAIAFLTVPRGVHDLSSPAMMKRNVTLHTNADSWKPMSEALLYLRGPGSTPVYTEMIHNRGHKFQYPLSSLLLFAPFHDLAKGLGISLTGMLAVVGWGFVALLVLTTVLLLQTARPRDGPPRLGNIAPLDIFIVSVAALSYYPLIKGLAAGQIQIWMNAIFAVALLMWLLGRLRVSGALVGLLALIKPHFAVFLLWSAVRREWRFVAAATVVVLSGLICAAWAFGLQHELNYLKEVSFISERGEAYFRNHSLNGVLNRIMSLGDPQSYNNLEWRRDYFPPYTPLVYWGTIIGVLVVLMPAIFLRSADRAIDFCTIGLSATIASPIAWEHHYGLLFPIYAVMVAKADDRATYVLVAMSFVLTSNFWVGINALSDTPFNFLQSYVLLGGLILLGVLYRNGAPWRFVATPAARPLDAEPAG